MFRGTQRFRPLALIGQGSMGLVYRATDVETGQEVALKALQRLVPEQLYHLKQEFRSLAGVLHPNLVELHELVVDAEQCFFTMELIDGVAFVDHVRDGGASAGMQPPLDVPRLERSTRQLVLGISALHAAGKLHRDVKPSNVLVTRRGRVVVLDFGLVTALRPEDGRRPEPGGLAGSLAYIAIPGWGSTYSDSPIPSRRPDASADSCCWRNPA